MNYFGSATSKDDDDFERVTDSLDLYAEGGSEKGHDHSDDEKKREEKRKLDEFEQKRDLNLDSKKKSFVNVKH